MLMDEVPGITTPPDVSCRNLGWYLDLCAQKNIDPERILRGVGHPVEKLRDPSCFIDWESHATLVSNFSKYLTEEELRQASRLSWRHNNMRAYRLIGRLLLTLKDQFHAIFGPLGSVAKLYPCHMSLFEIYPGHLQIVLEMYEGYTPCHAFHVQLAGQMAGLPEPLGYPAAEVTMTATHRGATYDVRFQTRSGLLPQIRKAISWPFTALQATRELTVTHAALLEKYRELHEENAKLGRAEQQLQESETRYRSLAARVHRNHTEREAVQRELQERQESYQAITTSAQDAIVTIDEQGRITLANPATTRLFGYEPSELIGRDITDLLPEMNPVDHWIRADSTEPGASFTGTRKDNSRVPLEISFAEHNLCGKPHFTGIIRDVTFRNKVKEERKQLEQQLLAAQKMESIGQLTGGIAHDFNNLLVAILGYAELGLKKRSDPEILKAYLTEIKQAGKRAADLTQKLLAFGRQQIMEPDALNINDLVYGLDLMIRRLLPENIEVRLSSTDESLVVMGDKGQLEQVIVNLAVNARDAMPHGGRLNISTERARLDEGNDFLATKGDYVLIRVSDTGHGMSEEVKKRVFEPFFTTKPEGSGTGLGLAVVFGIVKQHEGFVDIQSETGQGSSIKIYLPLTDKQLITSKPGWSLNTVRVRGGSETILIVEDNKQVRELAQLILQGAGYKVVVASNGQEALNIFKENIGNIDLALLDVVMPRMGGQEVMNRMRELQPDLKVMFASGYSASGVHADFIMKEGLELIRKPYSSDGLRSSVRKVLDLAPKGKDHNYVPGRIN